MATQLSQGAVLKMANTTTTLKTIGQISSISGPGQSAEKIDVSGLDASSKTYLKGVRDGGDMTFDIFYDATDDGTGGSSPEHDHVATAMVSGTLQDVEIIFSDTANKVEFTAYVTGFDISQGVDEALTASVTLGITGGITYPT